MNSTDNLYEKVLLERLKDGDSNAFSTIFSVYYSDLILFANTFTKDLDTSKEIVQNVFVKLWENRFYITIDTSLKSYLLKTVQNSSLDWLRHLKIRDKYSAGILKNPCLFENDTENYVLYSELEQHLEKVLSQLPNDLSIVFRLNRYDGLKYQEIAEKLNVSVRTIEVRMSKVLNLLQLHLSDYLFALILLCNIFFC